MRPGPNRADSTPATRAAKRSRCERFVRTWPTEAPPRMRRSGSRVRGRAGSVHFVRDNGDGFETLYAAKLYDGLASSGRVTLTPRIIEQVCAEGVYRRGLLVERILAFTGEIFTFRPLALGPGRCSEFFDPKARVTPRPITSERKVRTPQGRMLRQPQGERRRRVSRRGDG